MIETLDDLSSDRSLKIAFDTKKTLTEFWLTVANEYPQLSTAAVYVLLPFGTTYLCERMFSILSYVKNKYSSKLKSEDDLPVAVSQIKPRVDLLCFEQKVHCSH